MTEKLRMVPIDQIRKPKNPIRQGIDRAGVVELADSIRKLGLIEPLILEREGKGYRVVAGHRRYLACKMAGLSMAPAIVVEMDDLEKAAVSWHENAFRTDVKPEHEAHFIRELMDRHQASQADVAALLGRSPGWISDRLRVLSYPESLREAMNTGAISFAVARELAHISDPAELDRLVGIAAQNGCSARTAASWRQAWQARQVGPPSPPPPKGIRGSEYQGGEPYQVVCELCGGKVKAKYERVVRCCPGCYQAIMRPQEQAAAGWPSPPEKEVNNGT